MSNGAHDASIKNSHTGQSLSAIRATEDFGHLSGVEAMHSLRSLRVIGSLLVSAAVILGSASATLANPWPSRTIKLVVPFPPGGAADAVARIYAEKLSINLKQAVIIENKPGAGTAIAADTVAKAEPDGYTLSLAPAGQLTILPHINKELSYDPFKSFAPVSLLASVPYVVAASPASPISSLSELIAAAKREPGKLTFSSCGAGTLCHLSGEFLKSLTGTDMLHIPFKGSAPAVTALLGNQVDLAFDTLTVLAPQIAGGQVKGLAVTSKERSALLPNVPTAAEAGLPELVVDSWFGLAAPAATPREIVDRLNAEMISISNLPEVRERLGTQGLSATTSTPAEFAKVIADDHARWGRIVKESNAQIY